ncbi:MAG: bifunctional diaminohydroxyphosphoribosylaminopyrimidine deaminase/5-amino-6-(5-phosphoribosylamino)uracil reductase RibD [Hyphomicrobiaceae bacterium]
MSGRRDRRPAGQPGRLGERDDRQDDHRFMGAALLMARRALGSTAPNPSVGAVIVVPGDGGRPAELVARAATQPGGRPHAETEALRQAGARAKGATLYVTLEPCAHHGRTPPCAEAVIAAGIARVVIGTLDPDPRVAGRGVALIEAAGIAVQTGMRESEARAVALGHILRVTEGRPFVQIKMALGADGRIARGADGRPVWVTGAEARAAGHMLRAEADAILVGAGTVRDDDPDLTCRLPGMAARSPLRVVLDPGLGVAPSSRLVKTAREVPLLLVADAARLGDDETAGRQTVLTAACAEVEGVATVAGANGGRIDPRAIMGLLARRGVTRLLIEGGPAVWRAFLDAGLADEVVVFRAGDAGEPWPDLGRFGDRSGLERAGSGRVGADRRFMFRRVAAPAPSVRG